MFRPLHIRRYVALMQARGFDAAAVLDGSGLLASELEQQPGRLVTLEQCRTVVNNMVRLSGDSGLGLTLGAASRITDIGIIGHAMVSSRTVRQMVGLWVQYGNALAGNLLDVALEDHAHGEWGMWVVNAQVAGAALAFCVEDHFVSGLRWGSLISGEPFRMSRMSLSYPPPAHAQRYAATFGCPVEFNAEVTRVWIRTPALDQPLQGDSDTLNDICVRHCQAVLRQVSHQSELIGRLRSLFLQSATALPTMPQAALALGLSVRTLRRRLLDEGTTYQALLDRFRHDLAREYLSTGQMAPKEVAYLLGFSYPSNFRRAFAAWSGQTVGDYLAVQARDQ